jgi:hypothetical protein
VKKGSYLGRSNGGLVICQAVFVSAIGVWPVSTGRSGEQRPATKGWDGDRLSAIGDMPLAI